MDTYSEETGRNDLRKTVEDIKNHVVQIEGLILFTILIICTLSLQTKIAAVFGQGIASLVPFLFLALTPFFVQVTNPPSSIREITKWGMAGAGVGGTIGATLDPVLAPIAFGVPIGTMAGASIGFVAGALWGAPPSTDVITQGQAREYLMGLKKKHSDLTDQIILDATNYPTIDASCAVLMFLSDDKIKCSKVSVDKWLSSKCWKPMLELSKYT